jgi:hypothetical protein
MLLPGAGGNVLHILNFKAVDEVSRVVITDIDPWVYGNFVPVLHQTSKEPAPWSPPVQRPGRRSRTAA